MSTAFRQWLRLGSLAIDQCSKFGDYPAVYAFRDARTGDILKYGKTDRLRRRIFGNFIGGVGGSRQQSTTQFVHKKLFADGRIDHVEIAWLETKDAAEAEQKEKQFRAEYKEANGRRPIWDRQD